MLVQFAATFGQTFDTCISVLSSAFQRHSQLGSMMVCAHWRRYHPAEDLRAHPSCDAIRSRIHGNGNSTIQAKNVSTPSVPRPDLEVSGTGTWEQSQPESIIRGKRVEPGQGCHRKPYPCTCSSCRPRSTAALLHAAHSPRGCQAFPVHRPTFDSRARGLGFRV